MSVIGRSGRAIILLVVGAAGGGAALALASVPDSSGVVHACYELQGTVPAAGPNLRIIDPNADQTCTTSAPAGGPPPEATLNWNTTGSPGPPGSPGSTGPPGSPGSTGPPGPPGKTLTIAAGHTFTISGGQVITVGGASGVTVMTPAVRSNAPNVAHVGLGSGRDGLSFAILEASLITGNNSSGTGGGAGKVAAHDIQITKVADKASAKLLQSCATGKHFSGATVTFKKGSNGKFLVYKLQNVLVSSYQIGSGANKNILQESLTLNFGKITVSLH